MDDPTIHPFDAAQRQRQIMLRAVRMAFAIIVVTVAILNAAQSTVETAIPWFVPVIMAALFIAVALFVDLYTPNKKISSISSVFLGILGGMLATIALASIMDLLLQTAIDDQRSLDKLKPFMTTFKVMLGITLCYLGITTVLQTQDDLRLVIPYIEFAKVMRGQRPLLLDTSALIDARIADVGATGIIQTPLIVPRFVIAELQVLADSHDKLKRARGRRGLDVVRRLQRSTLDVSIDETIVPGKAVDQMLIELARRIPATIVTSDLGLARVAEIQSIPTLNLNDVANALKPALVPGEMLSLRLIKPGEQHGQAVGYLDDGTMVVTDSALHRIGELATVMVTSTLQTSAGRLIFARLHDEESLDPYPDGSAPMPSHAAETSGETGHDSDTPREHHAGEEASHTSTNPPAHAPEEIDVHRAPASVDAPAPPAPRATPGGAGSSGEAAKRPGPFPPKPPSRRTNSARNPRR